MPTADDPLCGFCDEPLSDGGPSEMAPDYHHECICRVMAGAVAHQLGKCSCYGGIDDPDPPGMTKRQAAKAAFDEMNKQIVAGTWGLKSKA